MSRPVQRSLALASPTARVLDVVELTKPRITFMVVVTTAAGYLLGAERGAHVVELLHTMVGTAFIAAGASALNQLLERDADARMERTRNRPLPAGRLEAGTVLAIGMTLATIGTAYLASLVNGLTAGLGVLTLALYVLAYTPLKQVSSLCTIVGAVPGALPPVMGWAAARDDLSTGAWVLFAILFLWQMPHFLAIAWMYRDDYRHAGQPMLPVVDADGSGTGRQMVLYALALLPVSLLPSVVGLSGPAYFVGALALGLGYLAAGVHAARAKTTDSARLLLRVSVVYLPVLLGLMTSGY